MNRRAFLKAAGLVGSAAVVGPTAVAKAADDPAKAAAEAQGSFSILVDTTKCVGCRTCERSCAEANELPEPPQVEEGQIRQQTENQFTAVSEYETDKGSVFVKKQCMHCLQPACATACLTQAMKKTDEGPVIWRANKCMGCRYCMVSCPFGVPKYEYDSAIPRVRKCQMCFERTSEGKKPACVETCPMEAIIFGSREEMLREARKRIVENPDQYVDHIYGEHEAGGTGVLYLSSVPFEQLGFKTDLGNTAYPEYTKEFLYAVPAVLTVVPPFLLGLFKATQKEGDSH